VPHSHRATVMGLTPKPWANWAWDNPNCLRHAFKSSRSIPEKYTNGIIKSRKILGNYSELFPRHLQPLKRGNASVDSIISAQTCVVGRLLGERILFKGPGSSMAELGALSAGQGPNSAVHKGVIATAHPPSAKPTALSSGPPTSAATHNAPSPRGEPEIANGGTGLLSPLVNMFGPEIFLILMEGRHGINSKSSNPPIFFSAAMSAMSGNPEMMGVR